MVIQFVDRSLLISTSSGSAQRAASESLSLRLTDGADSARILAAQIDRNWKRTRKRSRRQARNIKFIAMVKEWRRGMPVKSSNGTSLK